MIDVYEAKFRVGKYLKPVTLYFHNDQMRIYFKYKFNKAITNEIRSMQGRKWHSRKFDSFHNIQGIPDNVWSIPINDRNRFQLDFLLGKNPYARYDQEITPVEFERSLYAHQKDMASHILTVRSGIWACEMGTGKTLAAIAAIETVISEINEDSVYFIAPKSALVSVKLEFEKWGVKGRPRFLTYEGLKKLITDWPEGKKAPQFVVFDESSRIKTPTSQRSQAAMELAKGVREDWGENGYVLEMTGTPAPKSPVDWWHQAEVACPGFLKEGTIHAFTQTLAIIQERENPTTGGKYPHRVAWKDCEGRCSTCGVTDQKDCQNQDIMAEMLGDMCPTYQATDNEVERLYRRLKGLVIIKFKKDCLDLPEKRYEIIKCEPSAATKRAAKLIPKSSATAIQALIRLRELSDGFQYETEETGKVLCTECDGRGEVIQGQVSVLCPACGGSCELPRYKRTTVEAGSPKDDVLRRLLGEHDEVGRFVVFGGFTGTLDRVQSIAQSEGWATIFIRESAWRMFDEKGNLISGITQEEMIKEFQDGTRPKVCFIAHPKSGGMGLTLTASPSILFFSNSFSGEDRMQAEDRIHRAGMDVNRGATIYDIFHLDSDKHVHENLMKKRELQDMTLGELSEALEQGVEYGRTSSAYGS